MTDQGIFFLALHFLIEACIVTARWTWERVHPDYNPCKYQMFAGPQEGIKYCLGGHTLNGAQILG